MSLETKKVTRGQEIASILRERIISGEIPGGERLRQDAIAAEFGISAIPVREALNQLEALGLVTVSAHRGAVVRELSVDEIGDLFRLRATVESSVLRDAVPRMTELDFKLIERALEAFKDRKSDHDLGDLNWRFHAALYGPSGRRSSLEVIQTLHARTERYQRLQLALKGGVARAEEEHQKLVELCRAGSRDQAVQLLFNHIIGAGAEVIEMLSEQPQRAPAARGRMKSHSAKSAGLRKGAGPKGAMTARIPKATRP